MHDNEYWDGRHCVGPYLPGKLLADAVLAGYRKTLPQGWHWVIDQLRVAQKFVVTDEVVLAARALYRKVTTDNWQEWAPLFQPPFPVTWIEGGYLDVKTGRHHEDWRYGTLIIAVRRAMADVGFPWKLRMAKRSWWAPHKRGDASLGTITKEYRL